MPATVWRGRIAFGMVSIPVRLHKAARRERIRFHHVRRRVEETTPPPIDDMAPSIDDEPELPVDAAPHLDAQPGEQIVRVHHDAPGDAPAPPLLKGYEMEKDQYVVLEPHEIAELRPRTSTELSILEFVLIQEIDPLYFDTSYYVVPERGGEKPYSLLFQALRQSGYVAMGTVAMHGREHAVVIRPGSRGLVLHTLFYANEVRSKEEYAADPQMAAGKELELATMLIQALAATFDPAKWKDTFEERLRELIETRAHSGLAAESSQDTPAKAPVADILEALRKSLAIARKPVQSETAPKSPVKRRRAGGS